jgi:copper(I)-binding protein
MSLDRGIRPSFSAAFGALAVIASLLAAGAGHAQEVRAGGIVISEPRAVRADAAALEAVGTLVLRNETGETEALTAVRGGTVPARLRHNVEVGDEMRLVPVDRLALPRGTSIVFTPDALHLTFTAPETGWPAGDTLTATLVFETAGPVTVDFPLTAP